MVKQRIQYRCRECGATTPRWAGRCGQCGQWDALDEEVAAPAGGSGGSRAGGSGPLDAARQPPVLLASLSPVGRGMLPTGLGELDRVLGGGIVPSSVTLVAGEPGIGKSTLLLQALAALARSGRRALLVSAEESPAQVRMRAARLGTLDDGVWVAGDTDLESIGAAIAATTPDVVVVDSVQTVGERAGGFTAGTPAAIRYAAQALSERAKTGGPAVILVGHVTKDGAIAGPKLLEHLVDTVLSFEGERHYALRTLRAIKHRFGPVGEVGLWQMTARGLEAVADGAALLLADRQPGVPGSCVYAAVEGRRPLLVEVQALAVPDGGGRRSATRIESGRLAQLLAVLDQRAGIGLRQHDVYVSVVGGVRLTDPASDLAVLAAVASAVTGRCVPADLAVMGEVGLGGELRQVTHPARRLAEAARAGFDQAVVPAGTEPAAGIHLRPAASLVEALEHTLAGARVAPPRLRVLPRVAASSPG